VRPRREEPCRAGRRANCISRSFMRPATYSMPIGIVAIALAGIATTGCSGSGLRPGNRDGGAPDAVASLGGQAGSTLSQGGSGGNGGGTEAGSTAGTTGTGGSAVPPSSAGGAEAGSGPGADAAGDVTRLDGGGAVPDSSVPSDAKVLCGPVCLNYCPYGNLLDENGCEVCGCKPPPTVNPMCPCASGTAQGDYGCLTCGYCANGYVLDVSGCSTCSCNPPPCPARKCASCPYGYVKDVNGCLTCTCLPDPSVPCGQILDRTKCGTRGDCTWLTPGFCTQPPPFLEGCYDLAAIGCVSDRDCSDGRTCVEVWTYPSMGSPCGANCGMSCGDQLNICL
jgi:hypothetical protein